MKRLNAVSFVAGMLAILVYLTCALLAFTRYPLPYSPLHNWLSDLGNPDVNPAGALFYNVGIVLTGALLLVFFLGLSVWKMAGNRPQQIMLFTTQGVGILGALAMIMTGLFPINAYALHSFFSICLYILLGSAFVFSIAALRYYHTFPSWVFIVAGFTALMDLLSGVFHTGFVLEWVTVALLLCCLGLLGAETNRRSAFDEDQALIRA
jgi:hypothetical membrane protein